MHPRISPLLLTALLLPMLSHAAHAGLNAGAVAHLYWQVGSHGPADTSRYSSEGQPVMLVTVQGLKSFRGADVQILALKSTAGPLPDTWQGNGTGGCNDGNFVFARGGRGGTFANVFTASPAVPSVLAAQNQEFYNFNDCVTPAGTGLLWLSAAGAAGVSRNPAVEYAVWSVTFDLRGEAGGGPATCSGDLSDPSGPIGVQLQARSRVPCSDGDHGAVIQVLDENNDVDLIPIAAGQSMLSWENHDPPRTPDLSPPTAQVISPNGGESVGIGTSFPLHFLATDDLGVTAMDVDLSLDDGATYPISIVANAPYSANFPWLVPNVTTQRGRVRLTVRDAAGNQASDASDQTFVIRDFTPPAVTVLSPNGGEQLPIGASMTVLTQATDNIGVAAMTIQISMDGGATYLPGLLYTGPFNPSVAVTLPASATNAARIRVTATDAAGNVGSDVSDHDFQILAPPANPTAQLLFPNGGETLGFGTSQVIRVTASAPTGIAGMDLALSTDDGATYPVPIVTNASYSLTVNWLVANLATTHARIRLTIRDNAGHQVSDASDQSFTIRDQNPPTVTVLSPNGGETLASGATMTVLSSASDNVGVAGMTIQLSADGGASYLASPLYSGSYVSSVSVNLPAIATTQARVRVQVADAAGNVGADVSDHNFQIISVLGVQVVAPNGGENLPSNSDQAISLLYHDVAGPATLGLALSIDGGATVSYSITPGPVPYQSSYPWHVPYLATHAARILATVVDSAGHSHSDWSDANFSIFIPDTVPPVVQVLSPNGGESWVPGSTHWIRVHAADDRRVVTLILDLSVDGGATYAYAVPLTGDYHDSTLWTVPSILSEHCRIRARVSDGSNTGVDASDADFAIAFPPPPPPAPYVRVVYPNGGEDFRITDPVTVFWTDSGLVGAGRVTIRGSQDGGQTFIDLASNLPDVSYADFANLSQLFGPFCRIQVEVIDGAGNVYSDISDHNFIVRSQSGLTGTLASDFTAESVDGAAILHWTVGDASVVQRLEVSRRAAGQPGFELLAAPRAVSGAMEYRDGSAAPGMDFEYRISLLGQGGQSTTLLARLHVRAPEFGLQSVSPNPFRLGLAYRYALDRPRELRLEVRDVRGSLVRTLDVGTRSGGFHAGSWDGIDRSGAPAPRGVYFLRLVAGDRSTTRRVIRL